MQESTKSSATINIIQSSALIMQGDLLEIKISSLNSDATLLYNIPDRPGSPNGYFVDQLGQIDMPLIGKLNVEGLDIDKVKELVLQKVSSSLQSPLVSVRIANFRVSVLGEVNKPGVIMVVNNRITLIEAIGMAGDLTIYGRRKNILITRIVNGKSEFHYVDITTRDFVNSPFYYLKQNDVVYVEPGNGKSSGNDNLFRIAPSIISILTLITVIISSQR